MGIADREKKRAEKGVAFAIMNTEKPEPQEKKPGRPKTGKAKKKITFNLPVDLYDDAQKIAYMKRISFSNIVEELLKQYMEENKKYIHDYDMLPEDGKI